MATNLPRKAELEVRDVQGMFRQAAISFKASLTLFLTIALLLTLFKAAVLSGLRSNSLRSGGILSNSSLSGASHIQQHTGGGLKKADPEILMLFRILASLLPSNDHASHPKNAKQENSSKVESISSDNSKATDGAPSSIKRNVNLMTREGFKSGGEVFLDMKDTDEPQRLGSGVIQEDRAVSKEETQNEKQWGESSMSNGVGNSKSKMVLAASDSLLEVNHEIGYTDHNGGDTAVQHDEHGVLDVSADLSADEQSLFEDMFDMNEDTGASSGLSQLQIVIVSNETGKLAQKNIEDLYQLTYFSGSLWGEQSVYQGAMDNGMDQGARDNDVMTSFLIGLAIVALSAFFFVIVMFPHAMVLGVVAYSVVSTHIGRRMSARRAALLGLKSGIGRLVWLSFLHATLCYLQTRILRTTFFGGILETEQVKQLSRRLSTRAFSILAPLRDEFATDFRMASRIGLFIGLEEVCGSIAYCIYVVTCWILVMERNHKVFGAIKRSCYLIKGMILQALVIGLLKGVTCGLTSRWLLQQAIGKFSTDFVLAAANLYFLVLWFIFYLSVRSVNDQPHFSYRTLEDFLDPCK